MKILFACGGTAGHINPAIAIADAVCKDYPGTGVLFAGNPGGMEAKLAPKAGYRFAPIEIQGFRRSLNAHNIRHNLRSAACLVTASSKARAILRDFGPDIVVGTGGYVSGPVLRTAAKMGIKTITHEQNAFPGITTKLLTKYVDKVLLAVEQAKVHLPKNREYIVTGNPIRGDILLADREQARQTLGVRERLCLLSFGGSLGAQRVNEAVADVMAWHTKEGKLHHIHATGRYGVELFAQLLREKGINPADHAQLDIREYIDDMPQCLAAADLVICRAGAISISELEAAGRASVLIPSPNVAENHQYHNAKVLADKNAAILIEEKNLSGKRLCEEVEKLVQDPQEIRNIAKNARSLAITNANRRICAEIYALLAK